MTEKLRVIRIAEGPITVAYRQDGEEWLCTALEFDLVGVGATREEALGELKEIFGTYLIEVLRTPGKVAFYNPSEAEEWNNPDKAHYEVSVLIVEREEALPASGRMRLEEVRLLSDRVQDFELTLCA